MSSRFEYDDRFASSLTEARKTYSPGVSCWKDSPLSSPTEDDGDYDFDDIHLSYLDNSDDQKDEEEDSNGIGVALDHPESFLDDDVETTSHRLSPIRESRFERDGDPVLRNFRDQSRRRMEQERFAPSSTKEPDPRHGQLGHLFDSSLPTAQRNDASPVHGPSWWSDSAYTSGSSTRSPYNSTHSANTGRATGASVVSGTYSHKDDYAFENSNSQTPDSIMPHTAGREAGHPDCLQGPTAKSAYGQQPSLAAIRSQLCISQEISVETTATTSYVDDLPLRSHVWAHGSRFASSDEEHDQPQKAMQSVSQYQEQSYTDAISDSSDYESNAHLPDVPKRCSTVGRHAAHSRTTGNYLAKESSSTIQGRYTSSDRVLAARQRLESLEVRLKKYRTPSESIDRDSQVRPTTPGAKQMSMSSTLKKSIDTLEEVKQSGSEFMAVLQTLQSDSVRTEIQDLPRSSAGRGGRGLCTNSSNIHTGGRPQLPHLKIPSSYGRIVPHLGDVPRDVHLEGAAIPASNSTVPVVVDLVTTNTGESRPSHDPGCTPRNMSSQTFVSCRSTQQSKSSHSSGQSATSIHKLKEDLTMDPEGETQNAVLDRGDEDKEMSTNSYSALHNTHVDDSSTLRPPSVSGRELRRSLSDEELSRNFGTSYGQIADVPHCTLPKAKATVEIIKKGNALDTDPVVKSPVQEEESTRHDAARYGCSQEIEQLVPPRRRSGTQAKHSPVTAVQVSYRGFSSRLGANTARVTVQVSQHWKKKINSHFLPNLIITIAHLHRLLSLAQRIHDQWLLRISL